MAKAIETLSIKLDFKDAGVQAVLDKVKGSFKGLERVLSGNTKPAIQKLRAEINSFAATGNRSISTINAQVSALRELRREADINSREFKELTSDISKFERQLGKAQGRRPGGGGRALAATQTAGAVISGGIFGGPEGAIGGLLGAPFGVPGAFAGAAIGGQVGIIRQSLGGVAETVADINSMKIALAGVSESAEDYDKSFSNIISISKEFLVPIDRSIAEFTKLKAAVVGAGFGTKETTEVFKGFSAAILATGGDSEKLSGALLAASQVFSKNKVQAEELRGQIGERLPGSFNTFAQAIGVSTRELDDMLKKGIVSTENFVEFSRTLFARYERTAETLGSSPERAGQRLQLALSLATLEYGGFFQKVGAGFQDYLANLVTFAVENKETFKRVAANVAVFAQDVADIVKGLVRLIKEAFGGMFVFLGKSLKVFVEQFIAPFFNAIMAGINAVASRVKLGQAERKIGIGRAGEIRIEELSALKKEQGLPGGGRGNLSIQQNNEIERRAQARILEEAGMAPNSKEDRFAAALRGLDEAFAAFQPTSGFGTSLGDPGLTGGGTGGSGGGGTGGKASNEMARRIEAAQRLELQSQKELATSEAQNSLQRLLVKQANERLDLERELAEIVGDGTNEEIKQAAERIRNNTLIKQENELRKQGEKFGKMLASSAEKQLDAKKKLDDQLKQSLVERKLELGLITQEEFNQLEIARERERLNQLRDPKKGGITDAQIEEQMNLFEKVLKQTPIDKFIKSAKDSLNDLQTVAVNISQGIGDAVGNALTSGVMGLIEGTKQAKEVFADFLKSVGQILAQEGAKMIATYIAIGIAKAFAGLLGGGSKTTPPTTLPGAASQTGLGLNIGGVDQGIANNFAANGGPVNAGRPYMVGERGPELFIPGSSGGILRNEEMRQMMGRSPAGAGAPQMNFTFETTNIGGTEFVSREQLETAMATTRRQAADDGAKRGMSMTLDKMQNSPRTRSRVGIR